jgi:murein DD-endopeptidase MepM/ murein hydrolase activator NlpD
MVYDWPIRRWTSARLAPDRAAKARWLASRSSGARLHAGVDLGSPVGTPVYAPENGTVVASIPDADAVPGWRGYGPGVVVVRGLSGAFYNLAHVTPVAREGDIVQRGAQVATVGPLAWPHVHLEVRARLTPAGGAAVVEDCADPVAWFERGEVVRWDGRCPERPGDTVRTPRACRPAWRGPRPAPLFPWPSPSSSSSSSRTSTPSSSSRTSSSSGGGGLVLVLALAAVAVALGGRS